VTPPTIASAAAPSFGFGGRLSSAFPSQVIVDVTERCNLACTHCPHPDFKKTAYYGGRSLDPALCARAMDEVAAAGPGVVQHVRFASEGEPLLHKDIFGMLAYAVRESGTTVSLTTNGVLLSPARIEQLLSTGIHLVDISIDAFHPDTYARIRVHGNLAVTRSNVERLIAAARAAKRTGQAPDGRGATGTRVVVSYIQQPENAGETHEFERYWRNAGADDVVIRRLHSGAGAIIPVAELLRERTATSLRRPCVYPWERVVLTPRGTLAFCPADWTHGSTLADYRTTTIAALWGSARYADLRRAHLTNDYRDHAFCGQCPDWQETRWPHEGHSYASLLERLREDP
jgi:pyruvate-formate lyase-activating enzyme